MARLFDDSVESYLDGGTPPVTTYPFTAGCFGLSTNTDDDEALILLSDGTTDDYYSLSWNWPNPRALSYAGGVGYPATSTATTVANVWYHLLGRWNADGSRDVYVDGGNNGYRSDVVTPTGINTFELGNFSDYPASISLDGYMAEVGIWNVALFTIEIWLLGKMRLSPLLIRPQNLVFYAPLVNKEDYDIVGHRKLTAVNGPTVAAHPPGIIYPRPRHRVIPGMPGTAPMLRAR